MRPRRVIQRCVRRLNAGVRRLGHSMRYQLVLQFPGDSATDYDVLVSLEERLIEVLGETAEVDGHDVGSGETNIFVLTNDPMKSLVAVAPVLDEFVRTDTMKAAYREVTGSQYTVLWPRGYQGDFTVL